VPLQLTRIGLIRPMRPATNCGTPASPGCAKPGMALEPTKLSREIAHRKSHNEVLVQAHPPPPLKGPVRHALRRQALRSTAPHPAALLAKDLPSGHQPSCGFALMPEDPFLHSLDADLGLI